MDFSNVQPDQLEAFRRLFSNESFINGLLSQGAASQELQSPSNSSQLKGSAAAAPRPKKGKNVPTPSSRPIGISKTKVQKSRQAFPNATISKLSGKGRTESRVKVAVPVTRYPTMSTFDGNESTTFGNSTAARSATVEEEDDDMFGFGDVDGPRRFVVGLDYGTTFSSVSYFAHPLDDEHPRAFPDDIKSIVNWPDDGIGGLRRQLPTESWYSSVRMIRAPTKDQFDLSDSEDEEESQDLIAGSSVAPFSNNPSDGSLEGETSAKFLWGYEVPYQRYKANTTRNEARLIERPKLLLIDSVRSPYTKQDQERLRPRLASLIKQNLIRKYGKKHDPDTRDIQDVISDFLIEVFKHTRQQLVEHEGFTNECPVSFVLTVPVFWSTKSSRILQYAVETAIRTTGFGTLGHGSIDNLFIVSEPEAAASYLMGKSHNMLPGETFVVLDCGGGTVDALTYTVQEGYPLRLKAEVCRPTGDNCGASYLNDNFEKRVLDRLASETYLDQNGETRRAIVKHLVPDFEEHDKRRQDITKKPYNRLKIPHLRGDKNKGFDDHYLILTHEDYKVIFLPLLQRVGRLLKEQIEMSIAKGVSIKKVFLIGGFGAAPSLRSYLRRFLKELTQELKLNHEPELVTTTDQESVSAVASGAVLRALNKENGPARYAKSSYGFLRIEPYQPKICQGHRESKPEYDEVDGEDYVTAIDYFMVKGTLIPPVYFYKPFRTYHTFEVDCPLLLCEEVLYVSDTATESHFALVHPRNKGKSYPYPKEVSLTPYTDVQVAGKIIVDMTALREDGRILPIIPKPDDDGVVHGKPHYKVEYDLVPIVEGRNLRYEARYPANGSGIAMKTGQISIAAAFKPGTG